LMRRWCGDLTLNDVGEDVRLLGWVHRIRDHGGLVFVDLRDRSGLVQLVVDRSSLDASTPEVGELKPEYVVEVMGTVRRRPESGVNPKLKTGWIEVAPRSIRVLSRSRPLPIPVADPEAHPDEALRFRYRYLDLRRPEVLAKLVFRHRAAKVIRDFFDEEGFLEVETPMLTRSTPEGARDFLVPARHSPGCFYALPQSPQLFKQILMVGGIEKYFQLARCLRDEDVRADRQVEHTQIDVEMSFATPADVQDVMERLMCRLFAELLDVHLTLPFPRITYDEAMRRYGTDKPDLRIGLELLDLTPACRDCGVRFLEQAASAPDTGVVGLRLPGGAGISRSEYDRLEGRAKELGARGLSWVAWSSSGIRSSFGRHLREEAARTLLGVAGAQMGDAVLLLAGRWPVVRQVMGQLRLKVAALLDLVEEGWRFVWVTDFPLAEFDEETRRYEAMHHPFTAPHPEDRHLLATDVGRVRAWAYDLVLNGVELGSGSVRNHTRSQQEEVFRALGMSVEEQERRFGFLLEALEYGAPPHAGIAIGFDRLLMLMTGSANMREVMAFPKTGTGACLLTGAPSEVEPEQLEELGIRLAPRAIRDPEAGESHRPAPET